jgi:membrane-associated PAP2 superfamily phosphatase
MPDQDLGTKFYSRDRCYDFLNIFAKKIGENLAFLTQNKATLPKNWIITLVFEKKRQFFAEQLSKIAENLNHSIGPWSQSYNF